jgi:peptidoglycan/xylan/chitin deacetylase (PgdA/CDA1 family)
LLNVPVIFYHKIDHPSPDARLRGPYTPPSRFARQMRYLKKRGFSFFTASELIEHYREHGAFPPRGISVTFDDGWRDNYTNAFPVLRELGIKATIFLVSSTIGEVSSKAVADGEGPRAHLQREEILEMSRHGIEFGSHSLSHRHLNKLRGSELKTEVVEAKKQIEELVQKPCKIFTYPAGYFSDAARAAVKDAGYIAAFTSVYGPHEPLDLYALNRTEILRRDRFIFQFARKVKPLL